ncbi:MAG: hypothetical protein GY772_22375 [bacterium]|nr:hypothetical protein [bacterium]
MGPERQTRLGRRQCADWFTDVGYQVENYGTDPHIEVEITPGVINRPVTA